MKRILVPIGCRSDEGLSASVIKRLREHFIVDTISLSPQDFGQSYDWMDRRLALHERMEPYTLVLVVGDRVEMAGATAAAFMAKVPIGYVYSGVINDPVTTYDDVFRHTITLQSTIQFCESEEAHRQTCYLMASAGLHKTLNPHVVGISHLDDLEVDESMVPGEPYNLLLLNWESLQENDWAAFVTEGKCIQIGGNPDGNIPNMADVFYPNLPRSQFLGLLKNCQRFITNSSAAIYEAPHFLKPEQIVMVGQRNRNRPRGPFKTGASDRIVEILREYLK